MSTGQMTTGEMTTTMDDCCTEYSGISRRGLLRGSMGLVAAATTATYGTAFMQTSYAATRSASSVLVLLSLRGACDGLSLVVPHGDPVYYQARPKIAVPSDRLLVKDGMFGLHPEMAPLVPLFNAGKMAAVHAVGLPVANRSHFAAMEELEDADPGSSARVGWLNRLISRDSTFVNPLRAIQLGASIPPTSLYGPAPVSSALDIDDVRLAGTETKDGFLRTMSMHTVWDKASGALGKGAREALQMVTDFGPVGATSPTPANGAAYPIGDLGDALAAAARTIRGDVGAEVITVDHGSWDHHNGLGTVDNGNFKKRTAELSLALAAFFKDLGGLADKVTVVTLSEFGRRVKENANMGLDHGHGGVMMLLGAGVKGGKYYGQWPGLTNDVEADLTVTRDYRAVLGEVIASRFGASPSVIFPGASLTPIGAMV